MSSAPHRTGRALLVAVAVVLAAVGGTSCSSGKGQLHGSATFEDVADLAQGAPVMMSDISIGHVTGIHLDRTGTRAKVTFVFRDDADVPAAVQARLRRTSALGEKFVELLPTTKDPDAPLFKDGTAIGNTVVVPDVEQLVSSGTSVFESLSASQIAILLDEGAKSFGGKAPELRRILDDFSDVAATYAKHTKEVEDLVADLDHLSSSLAPSAKANLDAIRKLNETAQILNENNDRFFTLVRSLNRLSEDGRRLLARHLSQIRTQIKGLRTTTDAVRSEQAALGRLLEHLPGHNETLIRAIRGDFAQVMFDTVFCGLPGGGEVKGDPTADCHPSAATRAKGAR